MEDARAARPRKLDLSAFVDLIIADLSLTEEGSRDLQAALLQTGTARVAAVKALAKRAVKQ